MPVCRYVCSIIFWRFRETCKPAMHDACKAEIIEAAKGIISDAVLEKITSVKDHFREHRNLSNFRP